MTAVIQQQKIKVNGIQLSYTDSGKGQPLVFIHGFPFNQSSWRGQAEALSKSFRVITFDIRGFGNSEAGNTEPSIDLFASDLLQLIDELKLGKVTACGLSMGGYILMNAVSRAPEKFSAIILADTQCIADSEEGRKKRFQTIEKIKSEGLTAFAEGFVQNMFYKPTLENNQPVVETTKSMITGNRTETVTGALLALANRKETCNQLKNVKLPALIICGREDTVTPLSQSELLNNTLPDSKLHIIDNAGHLSNLEKPEEFNTAVKNFIKGH